MPAKEKVPIIKYRYKLTTVTSSREAEQMENSLRKKLGSIGLSFFTICHEDGDCDVMGDSGTTPLEDAALCTARAYAAEIKRT